MNKREGFAAIAKALECGDVALAQIAAVLLQFPDPPMLAKAEGLDPAALAAELFRSGLLKGDWDPDKHPRTGTPPNPGWFAPKDDDVGREPKGHADTSVLTFHMLPDTEDSSGNAVVPAQFTVTPQGFGVQQLPGPNPLDPAGLNGPISAAEQQQIADALNTIGSGNASKLNPHTYNNYPSYETGAQLPLSSQGYITFYVPGSSPSAGTLRLVIENNTLNAYYTNNHYLSFYPIILLPPKQ